MPSREDPATGKAKKYVCANRFARFPRLPEGCRRPPSPGTNKCRVGSTASAAIKNKQDFCANRFARSPRLPKGNII
eukprot:2213320-Heterocapsa_arctica.AAC.1